MEHGLMAPFAAWESFYVIVGSSAAALTGLQFVVMVLGSETNAIKGTTIRAFASPTIVHFCGVLMVSALISAPWPAVTGASVCLSVTGLAGVIYVMIVLGHARRQSDYVPEFEDWLCHFALPFVAYFTVVVAAIVLLSHSAAGLFIMAGAVLLLLFDGIHNAWDAVTYIALSQRKENDTPPSE
jgi:hypothetical protein